MIPFTVLRDSLLLPGLVARGYTDPPYVHHGPGASDGVLKQVPRDMVVLTRGGGAGLEYEQAFDVPAVQALCIGKQGSYDFAERLAADVDAVLLAVTSTRTIGSYRFLYIERAGGGPSYLEDDTARRSHFVCSYLIHVESGLDSN